MSTRLFTYTPIFGGQMLANSVFPMSQKRHNPPSILGQLPPSLNKHIETLVQRFAEPSAMRAHLRAFPGTKLVDEFEELMRSVPIRQIHGKPRTADDWLELSKRIHNDVVLTWSPHPLSIQEQQWYRRDTKRRLATIYLLEEVVKRLQPLLHVPLDEMIMVARLDYSARFGRLFRINSLPVEILSNIFHYVVWSGSSPEECNRSRLALTGTCRLWRRLVISDATLWNTLNYRTDTPGGLAFSRLMIERSGTAPLDIRLRDSPERPLTQRAMEAILEHLAPRRRQLRTLSVAVQEWEAGLTLLRWLQYFGTHNVPCILRRLEIHRSGPPYVQLNDGAEQLPGSSLIVPLPLLGGAYVPSLRYFAISGLHIDWSQTTLKHLTTLDIRRVPLDSAPDMDRFRDILLECPDLDRLVLHGAGPKWRPPADRLPPVTLHKLRSLILADFALNYAQYVLSSLEAPDVRELALYGFTGEDYTMLFEQLTGLFPKVRLLTMISIEIMPEERGTMALLRLFASMPDVKFLQVNHINDTFWDAFHFDPKTSIEYPDNVRNIITDSTHILFPQLNCLDVSFTPPTSLCKFLSLRRHVGFGLDKVYVDELYWQNLHVGLRNVLRQLATTLLPHGHPSKLLEEEQTLG